MALGKTLARIVALGALGTVAACAVPPGDYADYAPGYDYAGYEGYYPGFYGSTLERRGEGERDHRRDHDRDARHDGDQHRGGDRTSARAGPPAAAPHPIAPAGS